MVVHDQNVAKPQYGQKRFTHFPPQFNFLHILNTFISPYCVVVGGRIGFFLKLSGNINKTKKREHLGHTITNPAINTIILKMRLSDDLCTADTA